jgi:hypothetical protein
MRDVHQVIKAEETGGSFHAMHRTKDFVEEVGIVGVGFQGDESLIEQFQHFVGLGQEVVEYFPHFIAHNPPQ